MGLEELVLERIGGAQRYPGYARMLRAVWWQTPPLFASAGFGQRFRRQCRSADFFAQLLVSNADLEGWSAQQLWLWGARQRDPALRAAVARHARDEARHARIFGHLLTTTFPALEGPALRARLAGYVPTLSPEPTTGPDPERDPDPETGPDPEAGPRAAMGPSGSSVDVATAAQAREEELRNALLLLNLYEVKALVLQELLAPVLAAWAPGRRLEPLMRRLIDDEAEHIRYTAAFLEQRIERGEEELLTTLLGDFVELLNLSTEAELSGTATAMQTRPPRPEPGAGG